MLPASPVEGQAAGDSTSSGVNSTLSALASVVAATVFNNSASINTNPAETNSTNFPLYMRIVATLACLIIFAIGVCGNLLVPLVVIKTKYLRNSTNLFLINLSVADLLVLIVCMPTVLIELHSRPETWLLGQPMCKLSNYVEMLAANGSIFTILAISFERYYAICKPLKAGYKCTRLRATIIICIIWLLASVLTSPILIMAKSSETSYIDGSLVYNCILETDSYWAKMYVFVSLFAFFCLPLLVLMLVYWLISKRLIRENLAMSSTAEAPSASSCSTYCGAKVADSANGSSGRELAACCDHQQLSAQSSAPMIGGRRAGLRKAGSSKSISSFLVSLHHHHYYPFSGHHKSDRRLCRPTPPSENNSPVNDIYSSEQAGNRRLKGLPNRAISLDQHLTRPERKGTEASSATPSEREYRDTKLNKLVNGNSAPRTAYQAGWITQPSRRLICRFLHLGEPRVAHRLGKSNQGEQDESDGVINVDQGMNAHRQISETATESRESANGCAGDTTNCEFSITDDQGSRAPFLTLIKPDPSSGSAEDDHELGQDIRSLSLLSKNQSNLTTSTRSESRRFRFFKRFSVSSSTASVQTNSTTLPSDMSVSQSYRCSSKHPSPRSILHRCQSKESGSQHSECNSRKKSARFDADLPEQHRLSIGQSDSSRNPRCSIGSPVLRSSTSNSSPSPDMSKSSSPDSMFHQVSEQEEELIQIDNRHHLRRQGTRFSMSSGKCDSESDEHVIVDLDRNSDNQDVLGAVPHDEDRHHSCGHGAKDSRHQSHAHMSFMGFGKHRKKRSGSQPNVCCHLYNNSQHHHSPEMMIVQDISKKQQMDSRRQVVVMLAFVVACFFLLFFPYRVFTIWLIMSTEDQVQSLGMEAYYNLTYFSRILIYLHSAINPIAYNLISTKFRRAFMSVLLCRGPASRRNFTTEHRIVNNRILSDRGSKHQKQSHKWTSPGLNQ